MNIVVMTHGEWQAFELVLECLRQKAKSDRLLVWDDFSPENWVTQMRDLAEVKQDVTRPDIAEHRNRVKPLFPENSWICMIDADERIMPGFIHGITQMANQAGECDAMFLERRNSYWEDTGSVIPEPMDYSKPFDPDFQPRVFKNTKEIRYSGPIHGGLINYKHPMHLRGAPFTIIHHRKNCPRGYESFVDNYQELVLQ